MTTPDLRPDATSMSLQLIHASATRLLASALIHLLDRDEPLPARWHREAFVVAVARHRLIVSTMAEVSDLDRLACVIPVSTFASAVDWLAREPLAAALAVRCLELLREHALPDWPQLVRCGISPRVEPAELRRWPR